MKVAPRKSKSGYRNGIGCKVCISLDDEELQQLHTELWTGEGAERKRGYRANGMKAYKAITGDDIDPKTITRHVMHVEDTWREVSATAPQAEVEMPVFPTDYKSMVDKAAGLSAKAMHKLEGRVEQGMVEDRDLISIAKIGVMAKGQQEANRVADKAPQTQIAVIFGLAGGHLAGELPEAEVIDVTPEEELHHAIRQERQAIAAHATGEAEPDDDLDAIL